jgi:hypothetical protein
VRLTWPPEYLAREEKSSAKARNGEISWPQHHRNMQAMRRVLGIVSRYFWPNSSECDICQQKDCAVFNLELSTHFAMISLTVCLLCGQRIEARVGSRVEQLMQRRGAGKEE